MFKEDDKEVKEILGRVLVYFMKISFDDLTTATHETICAWPLLHDKLIKSSRWAGKASETIDEELGGVFNEVR